MSLVYGIHEIAAAQSTLALTAEPNSVSAIPVNEIITSALLCFAFMWVSIYSAQHFYFSFLREVKKTGQVPMRFRSFSKLDHPIRYRMMILVWWCMIVVPIFGAFVMAYGLFKKLMEIV